MSPRLSLCWNIGFITLLLLMVSAFTTARAAPDNPAMTATERQGLTLIDTAKILSPRLQELSFSSTALAPAVEQVKVRVLLPAGYDEDDNRRYPVLYLFHGGMSDYSAWTEPDKGDAALLTLDYPMIVVMPDGGHTGYYVDWYNGGDFGPPRWETFHIGQLIPWIDSHYRTIPERWARATAGASMGGHGAVSYAAKYPELIGTTAAFSGAVDLSHPGLGIKQHEPLAKQIFGSYRDEEIRWRGNSATDLANNLSNTDLSLYVGDNDQVEQTIADASDHLHRRLNGARLAHRYIHHPGQGHTWEHFRLSLEEWLPHLMAKFVDKPLPSGVVYSTIRRDYRCYGWQVTLRRQVMEFSALQAGGDRAFILTGSGRATVTTPVLGAPGTALEVAKTDHSGPGISQMTLDDTGRLTLELNLGPENPHQQFSPAADRLSTGDSKDKAPFERRGNGSRFYSASVAIGATP